MMNAFLNNNSCLRVVCAGLDSGVERARIGTVSPVTLPHFCGNQTWTAHTTTEHYVIESALPSK